MNTKRRSPGVADDSRLFSLVEYAFGHTHVVLRGYPPVEEYEDLPSGTPVRVLDISFVNVKRISCWTDLDAVDLRVADDTALERLRPQLGGRNLYGSVFLLAPGTVEEYIVAGRAYWAEYDLVFGDPSPLTSYDARYREQHPPVDGIVHFAE
ncbi:hypothetical protein [Saccharothrix hoggarensis]|uniref:Uncharacterized protein n=1 Tax=Saccharothrix hoggarensis TaxID=913853 RepID=A0ABW3QWT6_9PSEU